MARRPDHRQSLRRRARLSDRPAHHCHDVRRVPRLGTQTSPHFATGSVDQHGSRYADDGERLHNVGGGIDVDRQRLHVNFVIEAAYDAYTVASSPSRCGCELLVSQKYAAMPALKDRTLSRRMSHHIHASRFLPALLIDGSSIAYLRSFSTMGNSVFSITAGVRGPLCL